MPDIIEQAVGELIVRDSTSRGVKSATQNFQELYNVVRFNWWGIQNLGNAFAGIGGIIAGGMEGAVKASIDFDQGLTQVGRTAGITGSELDEMGRALRELALTKPISVGVLTEIAAQAAALGINGVQNITEFTGVIADLVATTNLTQDSAVQLARLGSVLDIQGKQWQQLGSAILFAGVRSAATETDIVNMSVRLSGAAAAAHLTAAEIVAISAAATSLGSSPQMAATSITRVFMLMSKAIAEGGDKLQIFARVSGYEGPQAAQKFAQAYQQDAGKALASFVDGIGKMHGNAVLANKTLLDLGISGQRGAQTVLQLAAGTRQTSNDMLNLTKNIDMVTAAYNKNTELTKQANVVYNSTSNQLKLARNAVHDIAIGFGAEFLPVLNAVLKPLADVIYGIDRLPAPLKDALGILGAFSAAMFLIGGSAIALAPRIVLILGSIKEFMGVEAGLNATTKTTIAALKLQAEAEGTSAEVTSFGAGKISRAKREEAVARMQAYNAAIRENIERERSAVVSEKEMARTESLVAAKEQQRLAATLNAQATAEEAAAIELSEKGLEREAVAMEVNANMTRGRAVAAEEAAAASLIDADALAAQATAANVAAAEQDALAVSEAAAAVTGEAASGAAYALGIAVDFMLGPIGIALLAITAIVGALFLFGRSHKAAAGDVNDLATADQGLTEALRKNGSAASAAVKLYYLQNQAFIALTNSLAAYGYSLNQVYGVVTGMASQAASDTMFGNLKKQFEEGDKSAGDAYNSLLKLAQQNRASAVAAQQQEKGEKALGVSMDKTADSAKSEADSLSKLKQQHDSINNAILDLPDAYLSVRDAEFQVADAQKALTEAERAGANQAAALQKAEDDLAQARIDRTKALTDLQQAEYNLAHAREWAADHYAEAQSKVADDQDKLIDSDKKVRDLEQELATLRSGPSADDMRDAVNALADANIKLLNSQKKVGDAQYMLNYLMAEGASTRDISNAQDELAAAQQDVADNTDGVIDAQDKLNKVRAGADPAALAAKERELAAAERDVAAAQRQLRTDQEALAQERKDMANDTAYKTAVDNLREAHIRLDEANIKVTDSTLALDAARKPGATDAVAKAQLRLEQSLLALASAHTRVIKDTALMHGEQWGAGREAETLANQLGALGVRASGPVASDINKFIGILRQAKSDINDTSNAVTDFGSGAGRSVPVTLPQTNLPTDSISTKATGGIVDGFKKHAKDIAMGLLVAIGIALAIVAGSIPLAIIGLAAAIIGGLALIISHWGPQIAGAFETAFHGLTDAFWWVVSWLETNWPTLLAILLGPLGLFIKWLHDHWGEVTTEIRRAYDWVMDHWHDLEGAVTRPFAGAIAWVVNHWDAITTQVRRPWDWVRNNWATLLTWITNPFGSAVSFITSHFNGLVSFIEGLPGRMASAASGMFGFLARELKMPLLAVQTLWNSLWERIGNMSYNYDVPFPLNKLPGVPDKVGMNFGFMKNLEFHIPGLAQGGVAVGPTLAMIGEGQQHEAIIPLDTLAHMFAPIDTLAMQMQALNESLHTLAMVSALGPGGAGGGDTYNFHEVMADPVEIAREVVWTKKTRLR